MKWCPLIFFTLLFSLSVQAETRLPSIFSDHMVLQRDQTIRVWGWDDPGQKVTVRFDDRKASDTADANGRWEVELEPMQASSIARDMRVRGSSKLMIRDILVGEVWLCSGQSNMEWPVSRIIDSDIALLMAENPHIRIITVPRVGTQEPQHDFEGQWEVCAPDSAAGFSAIGFYFARMLQEVLDVPVGMIDNAWGGSAAEAWVRRDLLEAEPRFANDMQYWADLESGYDYEGVLAEYKDAHAKWKMQAEAAEAANEAVPQEPRRPRNEMTGNHRPGNIYNGSLKPILGYAIKGAIWYQGESNASRASRYNALFSLLISSWREEWGLGNFPFYWVQLADFKSYRPDPGESDWAELREAQTLTLSLPNTGQAVIYDNGEATDIHPRDKLTVARRLLRHALAKDYGIDVVADSPVYCSHEIDGDTVIIKIRNVGGGLDTFDVREVYGFSIAGEDGVQVWADAEIIDKNHIAVRSVEVPNPVSVRYAWADNPIGNVRSAEGLLLTPFRTDAPAPTTRMSE